MKNQYLTCQTDIKNKINLIVKSKEKAIVNNNFEEAIKLRNKEFILTKKLHISNVPLIDKKDILKVLYSKLNTPLKELQLEKIENICNKLKHKIKNHDNAIEKIYNCLNNYFMSDENKPLALHIIGTKITEKNIIAQVITEEYENKYPIINIDFKEFKDSTSLNLLIGISDRLIGYDEDYLLKKLKDNNFAIVVIDNFNEGSQKVKNLIKSIIEKGSFLNGKGEKIYCLNTFFILKSNKKIKYDLGFSKNLKESNDDILDIGNKIMLEESYVR